MTVWTVGRYMTVLPQFIAPDQKLIEAHKVMRSNRIRHLPVIDHGRLVGIVSMGDLHLMETLDPVDPEEDRVEDAMTADPYVVASDAPLEDVARTMAEHKYGSAIVLDRGEVKGIFTTIDALRALLDLLVHRGGKRTSGGRAAARRPAGAEPRALSRRLAVGRKTCDPPG